MAANPKLEDETRLRSVQFWSLCIFTSITVRLHQRASSGLYERPRTPAADDREHSGGTFVQLSGHIMKMNEELLANVRIASPCSARWEDMEGDERSRFCLHCSKNVYNLSAMSAQAATELIRQTEGRLCGRYYQRADGTMLTADCPVGAERPMHWFKRLISAAAACLCLSGSSALAGDNPRASGATQRALMGDVCIQSVKTNPVKIGEICVKPSNAANVTNTNPPALLGKICVQPATVKPPRVNPSSASGATNGAQGGPKGR